MSDAGQTRLRIFCAVALPEETRAKVARYTETLRARHPDVRASWERFEKLHLTLKFLGEIDSERVENLRRAAERAAASVPPFEISIAGTGVFPPRGASRVLWLGVRDEASRLSLLQQRLEDECAREGFEREPRPFHPHLTLARLRTPAEARTLCASHLSSDFTAEPFRVSELIVMRSELSPGGSRHTPLHIQCLQ